MQNFKFYFIIVLCLSTAKWTFSQNKLNISIENDAFYASPVAEKVLERYNVISVETKSILENNNSRSFPKFTFKNDDGIETEFILEPTFILPKDAQIKVLTSSCEKIYREKHQLLTYKGISVDGKSTARMTFATDFIYGNISINNEVWYIEPLRYFDHTAPSNVSIIYKSNDIKSEFASYTCHHSDDAPTIREDRIEIDSRSLAECYKTKIAILADYSMFIDPAHAGIDNVVNHVVGVLNNVEGNYEYNGNFNFDDGLNFEISEVVISTCSTCDPLSPTTSPNILLNEFNTWVANGGFNFPMNGGHFWTNRDLVGSTIGLAYQSSNLYCNSQALAILEDWTNTASLMQVMVSHEIGHNLNGVHDSTTGYILSPTVTNTSTWSATSKSAIGTQITNQGNSCLDACGPELCERVQNISISNITETGFNIQWDATTENTYFVQIKEQNTTTFLESFTTNQNALILSPPGFEICKKYEVHVSNVCGGDISATHRLIFQSPTSQGCANFTVTQPLGWSQLSVQFSNNSINGNTYLWDFGNGMTSTDASPTVTYTEDGSYDVSLTVNNIHTFLLEDAVNILPTLYPPFTINQGGNMDASDMYFCPLNVEGSINLWEKGTTNGTSSSPLYTNTNAWKTGLNSVLPIANTKSALCTSKFDLTHYNNYTLSFDMSIHTQYCNGPTALQLQYSIDGGNTWSRLGDVPEFYNTGPGEFCQLESQVFTDRTGWTNYYSTPIHYETKTIDISSLSGNADVVFRFLASVSGIFSAGYNVDGFLIDNFSISAENAVVLSSDETEFNAQLLNKNIPYLTWKHARNQDVAKYILERSNDSNNWIEISHINDTDEELFSFVDNPIFKSTFYKLKTVDNNGKYTYSDIKHLVPNLPTKLAIQKNLIFNSEDIQLSYLGNPNGIAKMILIGSNGNRIQEWNDHLPSQISTLNLPSGTYILHTSYTNGTMQNDKIILY